jgi:hypothetical protein
MATLKAPTTLVSTPLPTPLSSGSRTFCRNGAAGLKASSSWRPALTAAVPIVRAASPIVRPIVRARPSSLSWTLSTRPEGPRTIRWARPWP